MAADVQTLKYIIEFQSKDAALLQAQVKAVRKEVELGGGTMTKASAAAKSFGINIAGLAARAAITIPIWLAMRTAFMSVLQTIGDGAKYIVEFDKSLREMAAVSSEVANMPLFMKELGKEVQQLSTQTGKSLKEVSDIYYMFAETGMKATTAQAGMVTALKLSIATFADTKETARMMVDIYNMFGTSMGNTMTPMEKMEDIAGTFVTLWKENSGSLTEYIHALKMFAPIAKINNLTMKETLSTVVVLNNYMQRGSTGGTQLSRAFQELSKNASKFDAIGINIRNRTDGFKMFMEILQKLNTIPLGTNRNSLINSLFGERSQRGVAVLSLTDGLEKLSNTMTKMNAQDLATTQKALNDAYELQNRSLSTQTKIFDQLRKQAGAAFLIGLMGASDYEDAILKAGDALKGLNDIMQNAVIPGLKAFGTTASIVFKTILNPLTLITLGIATLAFNFKGLSTAIIGLGAVITAHPLIALATAIAAVTTAIIAFDNVLGAKRQSSLNEIKTKLKEGMPIEEARKLAPEPSTLPSKTGNWVSNIVRKFLPNSGIMGPAVAETAGFLASKAVQKLDPRKPITKAEIDQLLKDINDQKELEAIEKKKLEREQEIDALKQLTLKEQLAGAERMQAYGYDQIEIEIRKWQIMNEAGEDEVKLKEQALKITEAQIKAVNEVADKMSSKLTGAFSGILSGEKDFSSIGQAISDSMVENVRSTVSQGLTNIVMSSGIGDMFGLSMSTVKTMFGGVAGTFEAALETGGKRVYDWIVKAFNYGKVVASGGSRAAAMASAATAGMSGSIGGGALGTIASGFAGIPLFSYGNSGTINTTYNGQNVQGVKQGGQSVTVGQLGGSLMTGYGMYQSTRQSGGSKGMGLAAGALGAGGALLGGLALMGGVAAAGGAAAFAGAGSMAAMGTLGAALLTNPIGWIALGLMAGAVGIMMLASSKKKKSVQTTIQEQTEVNSVASKIDVSNKKLELINRNLVALRNTMETYILPTSAYFSTARNLEDEFALSARRGGW